MVEIDGEGDRKIQSELRKSTEKIAFPTALFATLCSIFSLIFQYYSTQMAIQAQLASVEYQEAIQNKMKFLEAAEELEVQNYRTFSIYQNMVDELLDAESCSASCKIEASKKIDKYSRVYNKERREIWPTPDEIRNFEVLFERNKEIIEGLPDQMSCELFSLGFGQPVMSPNVNLKVSDDFRNGILSFTQYQDRVKSLIVPVTPRGPCLSKADVLQHLNSNLDLIRTRASDSILMIPDF